MTPHRGLVMAMPEIPFDLPLSSPDDLDPSKVPRYPTGADRSVPGRINPWGEYTQAVFVQPMVMTMGKVITADPKVVLEYAQGGKAKRAMLLWLPVEQ